MDLVAGSGADVEGDSEGVGLVAELAADDDCFCRVTRVFGG